MIQAGIRAKKHYIVREVRNVRSILMSKESSKRGMCTKRRIVYGVVTVTSKGQISIPADLRADLNIKEGDQLLVLRRRDDAGLVLIKLDRMDELMSVLLEDEEFFLRVGRERGKGR